MNGVRWLVPQIACGVMLAASSISAQETALQLDPAQTKVEYTLGATLHTVHGTFAVKRGNIRFDGSGKASGELVVDAAGGSSGNDGRDRRMNGNVLESGRYPEIIFRPDRVEGKVAPQGPSQVQIHGIFAIHGTEHEMTLPFEVQATGGDYTATTRFTVPYVKWGMKNPSTLLLRVGDKVDIAIHALLRPPR